MNNFLPKNYEAPKANSGYMRFQKGENKFRILSEPILGWIDWKDNKPIRYRYSDEKPEAFNESKPVKHFWAMIVWDYLDARVKILEITQATVRDSLMELIRDKDWGDPYHYDIKVIKSGEEKTTKYSVNPLPHKPVSYQIKDAFKAVPIDLEALFEGADPFQCIPQHATAGIFEKAPSALQDRSAHVPEGMTLLETLKEALGVDGIATDRLEEWVAARAVTKNQSPDKVIQTCLGEKMLPKFKESYREWLGTLEVEVPF